MTLLRSKEIPSYSLGVAYGYSSTLVEHVAKVELRGRVRQRLPKAVALCQIAARVPFSN